jgi:SP family general alpha glucoside:H+ symporter-like MFS transporter
MAANSTAKEANASHVEFDDHAQPDANEVGVIRTLMANPKIIGLALFANLGAIMYGYDNLALSLCLSMYPFQ